jgi:microcystin-dependent protein
VLFAGSGLPAGFLSCDGSAVSRSTFSNLFGAIGTAWGPGNGSTTFNLPDLRGRAPIGAGNGSGLTARTLGQVVGAETHQLTVGQMPWHGHTLTTVENVTTGGGYGLMENPAGFSDRSFVANVGSGPSTATVGNGGGQAHNNMQPSAVVQYIISTGV